MKRLAISVLLFFVCYFAYTQCPQLIWSDEFNGTSLDLTKWEPQIGDGCSEGICGWGNNELQYYKAENAEVSNGTLKIVAKRERVRSKAYTSARLRTKNLADFTFGRFEARIKLPQGQGLWPAFWMLSSNEPYGGWPQSGEIDIMELLGQNPETVHGTIHYGDPFPNNQSKGTHFNLYDGSTFADDFHVFAIEWEPGIIRRYVDNVLYQTLTSADVAPSNWPFDSSNQMHFLLNVAVGGNWPGDPDNSTPFPSQMEVDYVRVYDNGFNPSISGNRLVSFQATGEHYSINNASGGSTFNWTVPEGATITNGQGSSSISVDWGSSGGDILCDVTTNCINQQYAINVTVEPDFVLDFSFENFDDPENITFISATGSLTEVVNPFQSGINTSMISGEYIRNSQEQYDVIAYSTSSIPDAATYKSRNKKFYMDVLTQAPIGTQLLIQLENSSAATSSNYPTGRHSRYLGTITKNGEWERIVFEYLDSPDGSTSDNSVDQIILLFNSNSFTGDTYNWDNFDSYNADDGSGNNLAPTATYDFTTNNLEVNFDGSGSYDSDGSVVDWSWDFGDGNTGSGTTTNHTYTSAGDYTVELVVTDNEGGTDVTSQVVSVIDGNTGDPTSMHVQSLVTGTEGAGRGSKRGTATVTIHDNNNNVVPNATVTGTFSGTFNEAVSGITGNDGIVTLTTSATAKGGVTVDLCVDDVVHATLIYDSSVNDITCTNSSSGNSSLEINRNPAYYGNSELYVFPNPVKDHLYISKEFTSMQIMDLTGKLLRSYNQSIRRVDISDLPQGTFVVKILENGQFHSSLVVKQ